MPAKLVPERGKVFEVALPTVVASLRDKVRVNSVTASSLLDPCARVPPGAYRITLRAERRMEWPIRH